jgi:hypothetical protein
MMKHEAHSLCKEHMNRFVRVQMQDGAVYDGVIENVDEEYVYMACPVRADEEDARYLPYPGVGYGFGYPYGYHYPRYRRYGLPLAGLLALSLLPYWYF